MIPTVILGVHVTVALYGEQTGSEIQDLAQGHTASKCDFFPPKSGLFPPNHTALYPDIWLTAYKNAVGILIS